MAKRNQNIDNFFKEKLSGFEVPDKKGNWQVLNHLLDARERRRRMARRALVVSSFLAVIFFGVLILNPFGQKDKSVNVTHSNSSNAPAAAPVSGTTKGENKNAETITNAPANNRAQQQNKTEAVKEVKDNAKQAASENKISNKAAKNSSVKIALKRKTMNEEVKQKKDKQQSSVAPIITMNTSDKKNSETQNEEPKTSEGAKTPDDAANSNNKTENENPPVANVPAAPTIPADSAMAAKQPEKTSASDSLNGSTKKDSTATDDKSHSRFFGFNLFAGANLYRTQSSSLTDSRNLSPMAGLEIVHSFSPRVAVGLGVAYCLQGGYHLSDTATQVSYFLEKNVSQQIILIRKQHWLYVPLTLYYSISDKHAVSASIQWSYLMNTIGDYTETNTTEDGIDLSQKNNVKGYMDGINSSAFAFSVGYRYSLSRRFDIQMRFIQEFTNEYTPQYFYDVNTAPSWSLQTLASIKF